MYTIAICDPDKQAANLLRLALHNVLDSLKIIHAVYYYKNENELYKVLSKYPEKYNLLFLEAELSSCSGIQLASALRKDGYEYPIAFIAQTLQFALDGYEVDACQYLLKPADEGRLRKLFLRLSIKQQQLAPGHLLLNVGAMYYKIPYSDITYIETAGRKIAVHTKKETITYPCKLSEIEEVLPPDLFVRCHQSFIFQLHAVSHIFRTQAVLKDGTEIPISRSYKEEVQRIFRS